jgi:hypothetical protein
MRVYWFVFLFLFLSLCWAGRGFLYEDLDLAKEFGTLGRESRLVGWDVLPPRLIDSKNYDCILRYPLTKRLEDVAYDIVTALVSHASWRSNETDQTGKGMEMTGQGVPVPLPCRYSIVYAETTGIRSCCFLETGFLMDPGIAPCDYRVGCSDPLSWETIAPR